MKKVCLFILFATISTLSFAQVTWNVRGGMNISNWHGEDIDSNAKVGYKIGGGMEYAFDKMWSLQTSMFLSSKGIKTDGWYGSSNINVTINQVYLELPVMAALRMPIDENINLVLSAGPYLAYGIGGKVTAKSDGGTGSVDTFGDDALDRFDAGFGYGVAGEFGKIVVGLDGQFGLVKVASGSGAPKNINFSLTLGYKF